MLEAAVALLEKRKTNGRSFPLSYVNTPLLYIWTSSEQRVPVALGRRISGRHFEDMRADYEAVTGLQRRQAGKKRILRIPAAKAFDRCVFSSF